MITSMIRNNDHTCDRNCDQTTCRAYDQHCVCTRDHNREHNHAHAYEHNYDRSCDHTCDHNYDCGHDRMNVHNDKHV